MNNDTICEACRGTGFYGDNGSGIAGNREWQRCECAVGRSLPVTVAVREIEYQANVIANTRRLLHVAEIEERVARAIYEACPEIVAGEPIPWPALRPEARERYIERAREALALGRDSRCQTCGLVVRAAEPRCPTCSTSNPLYVAEPPR